MKNIIATMLLITVHTSIVHAQIKVNAGKVLNQVKSKVETKVSNGSSQTDYVAGLKEALSVSAKKTVDMLGRPNGFLQNDLVKIPFPKEATTVEKTLRNFGMGKLADDCITSLNRAAEDASSQSIEIFISAIKKMSIDDAVGIVKGDKYAATQYLKLKTSDSIRAKMLPIIEKSLQKTEATRYWKDVFNNYNRLSRNKINPDLKSYVSEKALDALFLLISKEEEQIRKDPLKRTTELLRNTFGSNK
jgi:hypothetical protein